MRLFEAARLRRADHLRRWPGLDDLFRPGQEILIARDAEDVARYLSALDAADAAEIGGRGRRRVLAEHTADHRARELEGYVAELRQEGRGSTARR